MIYYRNAVLNDMKEVAEVHIATQREYFTSTLGIDLLTKFYTEFLVQDNLFIVAVDDGNSKIVGFCMGNYYGSKAEKNWEYKYRNQIIGRLFLKCLQLNKLALSRSIRRVKSLFVKKKKTDKCYTWHLLSLGVLAGYRRRGIAGKLIDEFERKCIMNPPADMVGGNCTIGAYKWNDNGCRLYRNKGYTIFEESKDKLKFTKNLS